MVLFTCIKTEDKQLASENLDPDAVEMSNYGEEFHGGDLPFEQYDPRPVGPVSSAE